MPNRHRIADVKAQLNDCMHHQRSALLAELQALQRNHQ